jgi:hypothetical protein
VKAAVDIEGRSVGQGGRRMGSVDSINIMQSARVSDRVLFTDGGSECLFV